MKFPSRILLLSILSCGLHAAPVRQGAVEAEIVSSVASVQPGQPFLVALRMHHDPHWHTYWQYAGTGYPTSLEWKLPAGIQAGPIQWPVPLILRDAAGKVTGYGYDDENFLLVKITPPPDLVSGTSFTLQAHAEWLMCQEVCMPGSADLTLSLPVRDALPLRDELWAAKITATSRRLPVDLPSGWSARATRRDDVVELRLTGDTHAAAGGLYFFSADGLIDYEKHQAVTATPDGYLFRLPVSDSADTKATRLTGVIRADPNWPGLSDPGLTIDVPLTPAPAGGATAKPATPASVTDVHASAPASASLLATLGLAFLGGLILNLMPCVFPVLGIKILGFVNQSGHDRKRTTTHGLVFALGVLLSFWALAGALLALRAGGAKLGWGFQLQSPAFVFGMAVFLLVFALNLSGVFEVGLSATGIGGHLQMKTGFTGSFFTGALATLVATPCSAPFLAPALGAALALPPAQSFLVFTSIAAGLALPYLLLSIFPDAIKFLPRPGAWMEIFKQLMAFPLYATVGWLLWVLAAQTKDDDNALLLISFGLVLVAMAAWAYGRFGQTYDRPARPVLGKIFAAILFLGGVGLGWPGEAPSDGRLQVTWEKWTPEAIAQATAQGKTVYVDFTARWCATCQTNKATVFHNDAVLAELQAKNVLLLRGDWTNRDPQITTELARWNRSAVPFNLIYAPGKADPTVLPELLTPSIVLEALKGS